MATSMQPERCQTSLEEVSDVVDPQEVIDAMAADAAVEAGVSDEAAFGRPGPPFDRRAPFVVGFLAALGVATAFAMVWAVYAAAQVLTLLGISFFLAVGLDPVVTWLVRHRLPRWAAVVVVVVAALGVVAAFLAVAIPVIVTQATALANHLPGYVKSLSDHHSSIGRLNDRFHVVANLQKFLDSGGSSVAGGALTVGKAVLGAVTSAVIVIVVAIYALADMPRIKRGLYHLAPRTRRARMVLLTDEIMGRVGGYVLGNLAISVISGLGTFVWSLAWGIPYPLLLALLVAIFDLVPIVGSTIGGLIVALVALTVSLPVAIATAAFYIVYRFVEDYVISPPIMRRTVDVPGLVTVVATLVGATVLGVVGALVAIPLAAAIKLLLRELVAPRMESS